MHHVHFIAIGGAAMHNLAIAISQKENYRVTGSDDEIFEPSYSRLKVHGLLPEKTGWFPEKIHPGLEAVILGMHAKADNPELLRAKTLNLKIYSFPEYLYEQTKDKTRIVIGGSHGKTTTTAMILYVLNKLNIEVDYMVGAQIEGFDNMVKLSANTKIAVFEGDEYLTSPIDLRPKFHLYKPHIAILTGIAWDHINVFPTFENYVEQFSKFVEIIEPNGCLIYFSGDEELKKITSTLRSDLVPLPYSTPEYEIINGTTYIKTKQGLKSLQIFGEHNLQNLQAARLACEQIGVGENEFYEAIADFNGASNRLQKIVQTSTAVAYKDFAHSPSKLKATVQAVKAQYPNKKLVACMELHTFSSLTHAFLKEYKGSMLKADEAFVYFSPKVIEHKRLQPIDPQDVKEAFGGNNLEVYTDSAALQSKLRGLNYDNTALLLMTSGNFSGVNLIEFARELLGCN
ncbi:MAG: peptidoglycan synthetase [Bacteroidales bacterium]|jgi:UDP-N-acetylmuramate: L-alanyl-gamma-D-glutamyl-meso-diaminopimelate ligase|nr:peptidoglycan synthetase [Bacteroidales bacterium]